MLVPYESDEPPRHAPAWRDVNRFWVELMRVYSDDCARAGVDNLDPTDLRYRRSHVASFMHGLIVARTAGERERIINEALRFLEQQGRQLQLEPPRPMRVVGSSSRPALPQR